MLVVLLLIFTGIYLDITIRVGTLWVPNVALLCSAYFLFTSHLEKSKLFLYGFFFALLASSVLLSPSATPLLEKFLSAAQFICGLVLFKSIEAMVRKVSMAELSRLYLCLAAVVFVLTALEVANITTAVSDSFVSVTQPSHIVYDAEDRYLELAGWRRPMVFTAEPSNLAKGFVAFVSAWMLCGLSVSRALVAVSMMAGMYYLGRSPVTLMGLVLCASYIWIEAARWVFVSRRSILQNFLIVIVLPFAVALGLVVLIHRTDASRRIENLWKDESSSEYQRIVLPFVTALEVLKKSPLFGAGVGGKSFVSEVSSYDASSIFGRKVVLDAERRGDIAVGRNAIGRIFIYFGLFGFPLIWALLAEVKPYMRAGFPEFVAAFIVLALSFGAFETLYFWGLLGVMTAPIMVRTHVYERQKASSVQEGQFP